MRPSFHAHLTRLSLVILIISGEEYKIMQLLIMRFSPAFCFSSLLRPNNLLSALFSKTLRLCS
jgi:hypothetical protein